MHEMCAKRKVAHENPISNVPMRFVRQTINEISVWSTQGNTRWKNQSIMLAHQVANAHHDAAATATWCLPHLQSKRIALHSTRLLLTAEMANMRAQRREQRAVKVVRIMYVHALIWQRITWWCSWYLCTGTLFLVEFCVQQQKVQRMLQIFARAW